MAMEIRRRQARKRRHGGVLLGSSLMLALILGSLRQADPTIIHSLVTSPVWVRPSADGLASVRLSGLAAPSQPGMERAAEAGEHLNRNFTWQTILTEAQAEKS